MQEAIASKACAKCHETKPLDEFAKNVRSNDGRQVRCRECQRIDSTIMRAKIDPSGYLKEDDIKKCCDCGFRKAAREFPVRKGSKDGRQSRCSECGKKHSKAQHKAYKMDALRIYSTTEEPSCSCCGEQRVEFLVIDHIEGNGPEHRKEVGDNIYSWLKVNKYPLGFQVLCYSCNWRKGGAKKKPQKTSPRNELKRKALGKLSNGNPRCACCGQTDLAVLLTSYMGESRVTFMKELGLRDSAEVVHKWICNNDAQHAFQVRCCNCAQSIAINGYCPHSRE